jgi:hypothetical protein
VNTRGQSKTVSGIQAVYGHWIGSHPINPKPGLSLNGIAGTSTSTELHLLLDYGAQVHATFSVPFSEISHCAFEAVQLQDSQVALVKMPGSVWMPRIERKDGSVLGTVDGIFEERERSGQLKTQVRWWGFSPCRQSTKSSREWECLVAFSGRTRTENGTDDQFYIRVEEVRSITFNFNSR